MFDPYPNYNPKHNLIPTNNPNPNSSPNHNPNFRPNQVLTNYNSNFNPNQVTLTLIINIVVLLSITLPHTKLQVF